MRDAIVISGWDWQAFGVPERNAVALASLGVRVLYCPRVISYFRQANVQRGEIEPGIYAFTPRFLSSKANRVPGIPQLQARMIASQILNEASRLKLRDPIFFYPHLGERLPLADEMKKRGLYLVHVAMDYPEPLLFEHAQLSDRTLVIERIIYHLLRARFGDRIEMIPSSGPFASNGSVENHGWDDPPELARVPHPRLGYLGSPQSRLNVNILREFLEAHPEWHFVSFGEQKLFPLPNVHTVPWQTQATLGRFVAALDVGFMPYDCYNQLSFHCLPLKRLDYFAAGLPVVSTPILSFWDMAGLVYLGDTADELALAVSAALAEPAGDPKRALRKRYAQEHSIERLAQRLRETLPLDSTPNGGPAVTASGRPNQDNA
jgi:glycosyltransferase involved in cell wall biosynthesis